MTQIFNRSRQRPVRQHLRKKLTETEAILWSQLKERKLGKLRFRRQYSIGRYVVDFYCPSLKLVIEIDGEVHSSVEAQKYDRIRDQFLKSLGLRIMHFRNQDVQNNLSRILEIIRDEVR